MVPVKHLMCLNGVLKVLGRRVRRKLGGFGHFARLISGNEPLNVRKKTRSPQILDQLLVCALFICGLILTCFVAV